VREVRDRPSLEHHRLLQRGRFRKRHKRWTV
jgi:hypothetical protein